MAKTNNGSYDASLDTSIIVAKNHAYNIDNYTTKITFNLNDIDKLTFTNLKVEVDEKDFVYTKTIMPTDIDVNLHTNNLKYNVMALDALTLEDLKNNTIKEYEIYFVNESRIGEKIDVYKKKVKGLWYIEGKRDKQTIFKAVIKFAKK